MRDLTKGSILKNLITLALPIMFSNFMQTVYNLTDAFWLGKLPNSSDAISVVGIAYPLVFFLSSFGSGFIVAGTSIVSQIKGKMDNSENEANILKNVTSQFILIFIIFALFFISITTIFTEPILTVLNTPEGIMEDTVNYLQIIMLGMALMYLFQFYEAISFGLGDSLNPMKIQVISVIFNIIIDPILIFGLSFIPTMGITGAAYATLLSRFIAILLAFTVFKRRYSSILPGLKEIKPDYNLLRKILKVAIPESLSRSMTSFGFFILQGFVNSFGTVVISVYSLGLRVTSVFMMPAFGISSALTSVLGQNLGAGKMDRVTKSIKTCFTLVNIIMFLGCLSLLLWGGQIVNLFISDSEVIKTAGRMYNITPIATFMFGMIYTYNGVFNATGKTKYNLILSIIRLWILRIPLSFILSKFIQPYPYESLWWAMVVSNSINLLLAAVIYKTGKWKCLLKNVEQHN